MSELKKRVLSRCKNLKIVNNLRDYDIYFPDAKSARLCWVYVVEQRRFADVFLVITKKQRNWVIKQLGLIPNDFGMYTYSDIP